MKSNYPHIFAPMTVKNMTIRNRIVMMPMGTNYGEQNGEMSFLHLNYYEQRAKGGVGLIIVENASVDSPQGSNGTTQLRIDQDNYIPRLFKLCESVHRQGACIAVQINHAGASAISSRIQMQPVSASDVPTKDGGEIPRPLTKEDIEHISSFDEVFTCKNQDSLNLDKQSIKLYSLDLNKIHTLSKLMSTKKMGVADIVHNILNLYLEQNKDRVNELMAKNFWL